jgi:hypothetical protein
MGGSALVSTSLGRGAHMSSCHLAMFIQLAVPVANVSLCMLLPHLQVPPSQARVFVISGPSGVGKDAVLKHLQQRRPDLHFVVTATSRWVRVTSSQQAFPAGSLLCRHRHICPGAIVMLHRNFSNNLVVAQPMAWTCRLFKDMMV